jgi:two-component system OmpR family sensor kinase
MFNRPAQTAVASGGPAAAGGALTDVTVSIDAPATPATVPWSLAQRITRHMLLVLCGLWLVGAAVLVMGLFYESSEVLDSALQETAERFLFLPDMVLDDPADQRRFLQEIAAHEEYVVYQIFDAKGQMRLRSHGAPEEPLDDSGEDGIRNTGGWRVLTMTRTDFKRRVQVAEAETYRGDVLFGSLGWLAGTLICLLAAASAALTIIMRQGRRALDGARLELMGRKPDDLRPLSGAGAPLELQPWIASVNTLMARDRVLIEAERAFAARTAHELRTPLAAARAQAQRLVEVAVGTTARQNAEALLRQLDRLARLASRLLQLARIESRASVRREPVDLAVVTRMVVADFAEALASERLRIDVQDGPTGIIGDIDAIGIALRNVIDNALKHGGKDAWVTVLVETLSVLVINDGPGVPPETLHKLVRPFERGITAAEGSGLGLSITQAIVRQSGGTLELFSPISGGRGFAAVLRFD